MTSFSIVSDLKLRKFLGKIRMTLIEIDSQHQILINYLIIEEVMQEILRQHNCS